MYVAVKFVSDHVVKDTGFEASYNCIEAPTPSSTTTTTISSTTSCTDCTTSSTDQPPPLDCGKNWIRYNIR